jgi:tRNA dimethylallyltransferase
MSVAQYQRRAKKAVSDILKRGKIPVLCGGTGLYIDAILNNQSFPAVPPDNALRGKLGKLSAAELFEKLKKLDAVRAKDIDAKNPHRLIRAIEIATALGSVPPLVKNESSYESIIIGLNLPREEIQQRIHARLVTRLRRGMVAEAKRLHASGLSWKRMEAFGLDYRYLALFLQKKITKESMMHTIERESWLYVKRQMVWFKRNKNIHWFRPDQTKEIYKLVKDFLENK